MEVVDNVPVNFDILGSECVHIPLLNGLVVQINHQVLLNEDPQQGWMVELDILSLLVVSHFDLEVGIDGDVAVVAVEFVLYSFKPRVHIKIVRMSNILQDLFEVLNVGALHAGV